MTPPTIPAGGAGPRPTIDWSVALVEHERWLRTVVLARLGEPQAVDEVMQEVSLAAVRGQAPPNDPNKVAPWLYGLAVRQALLYRRKQGRRRKMVQRFVERFRPTEQDVRTADPLDWLLTDERRKIVRIALKRLHRRDAEILLLKYTENWSYKELAERLDVSEGVLRRGCTGHGRGSHEELAALDVVEAKK